MARRGYRGMPFREPAVTRGPDQPIPEKREEIIQRMKERLEKEGAFRQDFSNGEFTSLSLYIGKTFEECKAVRALEAPGYTVHFDPATQLFWRRGGSFD